MLQAQRFSSCCRHRGLVSAAGEDALVRRLTYPHLSSPILTYADVHEEAQAAVGAAYTNVGIACNRMRLLERAAGAHFTCFTGTQVHIVTQKARAAEAHRGALDVRIRLRGQAHLETAERIAHRCMHTEAIARVPRRSFNELPPSTRHTARQTIPILSV